MPGNLHPFAQANGYINSVPRIVFIFNISMFTMIFRSAESTFAPEQAEERA
jgi:hypothetical protein